ncbi:MAG: polysaccharide deacetylase family protein [Atopobiaceae bacterium]|nr:polysaccharide deacetylase family protein [Atopobiaceae bacterium]
MRKRRGNPARTAAIVTVAVLIIGIGGFFLIRHLTTKHLVVNGREVTVARSATPRSLVEDGIVEAPKPGNLMAVDGSLLSKGDGDLCSATIDGTTLGVDEEIPADSDVQIGDGADTTEEYDEKQETIPYERAEGDTSFSGYWNGSIHLLSDGEDGLKTTKTGKQSGKTVEEVTKPAVDAGYVIYSAKPDDKVIALTFDDGPWDESTEEILDVLEQNNAKATFFTIGNQIEGHEDLIKRAAEMGCQICTHTWDHAEGSGGGTDIGNMSSTEQVQEVTKGYAAIEDVLGEEPDHILRAPGGNFNGDTIENLWDYVDVEVGWDVDTEDWRRPGAETIAERILTVSPGNVVLMHDGGGDRSQTVEALSQALPKLADEGYKFITVNELLEYGMPK